MKPANTRSRNRDKRTKSHCISQKHCFKNGKHLTTPSDNSAEKEPTYFKRIYSNNLYMLTRTREHLVCLDLLGDAGFGFSSSLISVHTGRGAGVLGDELVVASDELVRAEALHDRAVAERVDAAAWEAEGLLLRSERLLDFGGVDEARHVGVADERRGELPALLDGALGVVCAVDGVELLEGALRPDDEPPEVAAWGELQEVQRVNVCDLDALDVREGAAGGAVGGVRHDEWALAADVAAVSPLTLGRADVAAGGDLLDVAVGVDELEERDGVLGLLQVAERVIDDERDLWDALDAVTAGEHERRDGGGGDGGADGEAALLLVDVAVPAAEDLGAGVHVSATAHVAVGSLSAAVRATAGDAGDTCDGASRAPTLGCGAVALASGDGVGLASILADVCVDVLHQIVADRDCEDRWDLGGGDDLFLGATEDVDSRSAAHCMCEMKIHKRRNNEISKNIGRIARLATVER